MAKISRMELDYFEQEAEFKNSYKVFVPRFLPIQKENLVSKRILNHYHSERYATVDFFQMAAEQLGASLNGAGKANMSCSLFPFCVEYVLRNIRVREKLRNHSESEDNANYIK